MIPAGTRTMTWVWIVCVCVALMVCGRAATASAKPEAEDAKDALEAEPQHPETRISNGVMSLKLYLPDAESGYYQGTRFDWSGVIARAEYKGHTLFGPWKPPLNPLKHDNVTGPAEEFSMDDPPGYEQAQPGEPFLKIGVGLLAKPDNGKDGQAPKYRFHGKYDLLKPGTWKVTQGKDWIQFHQKIDTTFGYGYEYTKRISLSEGKPQFVIRHVLKNTGEKPIDTTHYSHNFIIIDDDPVGPNYKLRLPFKAPEPVDVKKGKARVEGDLLTMPAAFKGSIWVQLAGLTGDACDNQATVLHEKSGLELHIRGDRPLLKYVVYGESLALCPEPFIAVKAAPGETMTWDTTYTLSESK